MSLVKTVYKYDEHKLQPSIAQIDTCKERFIIKWQIINILPILLLKFFEGCKKIVIKYIVAVDNFQILFALYL